MAGTGTAGAAAAVAGPVLLRGFAVSPRLSEAVRYLILALPHTRAAPPPNRFNRWSRQGLWLKMVEALTGHSGIYGVAAIDSTHIKAHRSAAGGKGGLSASRAGGGRASSTR